MFGKGVLSTCNLYYCVEERHMASFRKDGGFSWSESGTKGDTSAKDEAALLAARLAGQLGTFYQPNTTADNNPMLKNVLQRNHMRWSVVVPANATTKLDTSASDYTSSSPHAPTPLTWSDGSPVNMPPVCEGVCHADKGGHVTVAHFGVACIQQLLESAPAQEYIATIAAPLDKNRLQKAYPYINLTQPLVQRLYVRLQGADGRGQLVPVTKEAMKEVCMSYICVPKPADAVDISPRASFWHSTPKHDGSVGVVAADSDTKVRLQSFNSCEYARIHTCPKQQ